ncbi:MAG TPA: glycosyltransferase family 4 protein, partial [Anaerolineae bacterium]|nr:glycosyltransferase family 4 protein [Anaerolineae bacterium]
MKLGSKRRLAFVTPRYGPEILGGAESLTQGFAERLIEHGWSVEVWTTCARDYHTWQNVYPAGVETINRVTVRRFPAFVSYDPVNLIPTDQPVTLNIFGHFPDSLEVEYGWADGGMHSPLLYHYLLQHGDSFDGLIFIPYPFGLICYAASIYPQRSIIWPCLHDDAVAYFEPVRVMLKQAKGIILNSDAEKRLLSQSLRVENSHYQVVGYGLEAKTGEAERFYQQYPHLKRPFVLYAGRLEKAKNVHLLLEYFINYTKMRTNEVNLVLVGSGPILIPDHPQIFHLGHVSDQDKHDAYAAATVLCQPSVYESFGITLLEAWLHNTPVLVHRRCQVTLEHCLAAQGGLYFRDEFEFMAALDFFLANPNTAKQMGINGRNYVEANYE